MLIYKFKGGWGWCSADGAHVTAFTLTDMAERGGQKGNLYSLQSKEKHQPMEGFNCAPPPTMLYWQIIIKCKCSQIKHCQQSLSLFLLGIEIPSVWWGHPGLSQAIQGHTKGLHRKSFKPANRQLHSSRPNNHNQVGAVIHMQLFTISPYPEQIHLKAHFNISLPISTHTGFGLWENIVERGKNLLSITSARPFL